MKIRSGKRARPRAGFLRETVVIEGAACSGTCSDALERMRQRVTGTRLPARIEAGGGQKTPSQMQVHRSRVRETAGHQGELTNEEHPLPKRTSGGSGDPVAQPRWRRDGPASRVAYGARSAASPLTRGRPYAPHDLWATGTKRGSENKAGFKTPDREGEHLLPHRSLH
jgi:hypothetical protein